MGLVSHYKDTKKQYGWMTILAHWLAALLIISLYFLGDYMIDLSYYDDLYTLAPKIHEALGILVLILMLLRIVLRLFSVKHIAPASNSKFVNLASHLAHIALYILILVVLISGLLISFSGGLGIKIFDWFTIPGPADFFDNQALQAGEVHHLAAMTLMGLVALHTLAALKHHYIDKDNTLSNMLGIKEK